MKNTFSIAKTTKEEITTTLISTLLTDFHFRKDIVKAILTKLDEKNWLRNATEQNAAQGERALEFDIHGCLPLSPNL